MEKMYNYSVVVAYWLPMVFIVLSLCGIHNKVVFMAFNSIWTLSMTTLCLIKTDYSSQNIEHE